MKDRSVWIITLLGTIAGFALVAVAVAVGAVAAFRPWAGIIMGAGGVTLVALSLYFRNIYLDKALQLENETAREKELESELDHQRQAIDTLAEGLNVGVLVTDPRARILYSNHRAEQLFKFENPIGRTILDVTISYELEQLVLRAVQEQTPVQSEVQATYPEERVLLAEAWPDRIESRAYLSIYDITDLRRLERVRRDFVANVSHELRTPLATIRAMAESLADDDSEDRALRDRFLKKIIAEVDRLSLITQDLLVLSTAESNPVRPQSCDLAELLKSVVFQMAAKAKDKGISLQFQGPASVLVQANPAQMTQVAINLVDNALNYTLEGEVNVELIASGHEVSFSVRDTGIGIPSEHLDRIFERFYRVDKGRSRMTGGTGLGLSIVKHIVEAHGGRVQVTSDLGRGSTFTVHLPFPDAGTGDDSQQRAS